MNSESLLFLLMPFLGIFICSVFWHFNEIRKLIELYRADVRNLKFDDQDRYWEIRKSFYSRLEDLTMFFTEVVYGEDLKLGDNVFGKSEYLNFKSFGKVVEDTEDIGLCIVFSKDGLLNGARDYRGKSVKVKPQKRYRRLCPKYLERQVIH